MGSGANYIVKVYLMDTRTARIIKSYKSVMRIFTKQYRHLSLKAIVKKYYISKSNNKRDGGGGCYVWFEDNIRDPTNKSRPMSNKFY